MYILYVNLTMQIFSKTFSLRCIYICFSRYSYVGGPTRSYWNNFIIYSSSTYMYQFVLNVFFYHTDLIYKHKKYSNCRIFQHTSRLRNMQPVETFECISNPIVIISTCFKKQYLIPCR